MTPFQRMSNGLLHIRHELNEELNEALAFTELMALKTNAVEFDSDGMVYVLASGQLHEVINVMKQQLERLERIQGTSH